MKCPDCGSEMRKNHLLTLGGGVYYVCDKWACGKLVFPPYRKSKK